MTDPQTTHSKARSPRAVLRASRRALTPTDRRIARQGICRTLLRRPEFTRARHVALYVANDGEVDPADILLNALAMHKRCYLPVLVDQHMPFRPSPMVFHEVYPATRFRRNRFGIPEPVLMPRHIRPVQQLDIICMPLVAFDSQGNRLGMGGGFYDRTLAKLATGIRARPLCIGLAYDFQELEEITADPWDIPMDAIATPTRFLSTTGKTGGGCQSPNA